MIKLTFDLILKALSNCIFDELTSENYFDKVIKRMDSKILPKSYDAGATKLVLTPPEEDFVIKIPFTGTEIDEEENFLYYPFEGANEPEGWDYCEAELICFNDALSEGVENYFLPIEFIGFVQGHPIYIQKKAKTLNDTKIYCMEELAKDSKEYKNAQSIRELCGELNVYCFNAIWLFDFVSYFGKEALKLLDTFLEDYCISDLHSQNIGYTLDGVPVIIDYGDYND